MNNRENAQLVCVWLHIVTLVNFGLGTGYIGGNGIFLGPIGLPCPTGLMESM